ncbi:MAG: hypothetical protein J2P47_12530 [Acetobacteraceae bacterium]|nr:hypothetical protein [Acetobacteraceae bacterium]
MITDARISEDVKPVGPNWITALRAPAIKRAAEQRRHSDVAVRRARHGRHHQSRVSRRAAGCLPQCRDRRRKRQDLLAATERDLAVIQAEVRRKQCPLRGEAEIGLAVRAVLNTHKVGKHFILDIGERDLSFVRVTAAIDTEETAPPPKAAPARSHRLRHLPRQGSRNALSRQGPLRSSP